jgi:hypothetical protein
MERKRHGALWCLISFLVGALAKQSGSSINEQFIEGVFQEIINNQIQGYYCEVRWCGNIDEPVASIESTDTIKNKAIQAQFTSKMVKLL